MGISWIFLSFITSQPLPLLNSLGLHANSRLETRPGCWQNCCLSIFETWYWSCDEHQNESYNDNLYYTTNDKTISWCKIRIVFLHVGSCPECWNLTDWWKCKRCTWSIELLKRSKRPWGPPFPLSTRHKPFKVRCAIDLSQRSQTIRFRFWFCGYSKVDVGDQDSYKKGQ